MECAFLFDGYRNTSSNSIEKLAGTLSDAQVDINPHQIEAALFAFRTPFSKGVILGDEVGLGKTVEACIVIAQKWAELKRRILIIVPANLKTQWQSELDEKFYLPSVILDTAVCKSLMKSGVENPFKQDSIIIVSYNFAYENATALRWIAWDLVVMDEDYVKHFPYVITLKTSQCFQGNLYIITKFYISS